MPPPVNSAPQRDLDSKGLANSISPSVEWLAILLFLTTSSVLFVWLFEWDRYQIIAGPRAAVMTFADKAVIAWLLTAKSIALFMPWMLIWGMFLVSGLRRTAIFLVTIVWIAAFYFMAGDLISVGFAGYHIWDYFPNIEDILKSPEQHIWQWAGEQLSSEALAILCVFVVSGPVYFLAVRWVTRKLTSRFSLLCSGQALALLTAGLLVLVVGVVPAQRLCLDPITLDRIEQTLPLAPGLKHAFRHFSTLFATSFDANPDTLKHSGLVKVVHAGAPHSSLIFPIGDTGQDLNLPNLSLGCTFSTSGQIDRLIDPGSRGSVSSIIKTAFPGNTFSDFSTSRDATHQFPFNAGDWLFRLNPTSFKRQQAASRDSPFDEDDELTALRLACDAADPGPADPSAFVTKHDLPNVILIIFESFRHSALGPGLMKRLDAWANQGLRLKRHYSGSNCSHLGLFSLFYGRSALGYHQTLDRKIPAQMLESLRRSGYKITFLTAGEVDGFRRLDEFISAKTCDEVIRDGEFTLKGMKDWPDSDRRKLARVRNMVNNSQGQPHFVFFYLVSSHYRYPFPPEFNIYKESPYTWQFLNPKHQVQNHRNRYANAVLFLEDEVLKFVGSIDPKRNLILVTGDHGESMGEDGVFTHGSRMSEIQMRVPFVMVGPGVEPRKISTATVHTDVLPTLLHALAGKSVNIANCQGRDLMEESSPVDRVAAVPANGPDWDGLMIIGGNKRILFRASAAAGEVPSVRFAGLADEAGEYELKPDRRQHVSGNGR